MQLKVKTDGSANVKKARNRTQKTNENKTENDKKSSDRKKSPRITNKDLKDSRTLGSLSGTASLTRTENVQIEDVDNHKVINSQFAIGPLTLDVTKTYKKGKSNVVRAAKAETHVLYGNMQLKVKADGSAHVKKVVFKNPESVKVKGSVTSNRSRSDIYLRNSVRRMRPLAAQKILRTARYVLKPPSAIRRS